MTKTKNLQKLIIMTILIATIISISPVNAELFENNFYYETGCGEGNVVTTASGTGASVVDYPFALAFPDLQRWKNIYSIVYGFNPSVYWEVRDLNLASDSQPVTYYIWGGDTVATGIVNFNRYLNDEGGLSYGVLGFTFDAPINSSLAGFQYLYCSIPNINFKSGKKSTSGGTESSTDCPYFTIWATVIGVPSHKFLPMSGTGYLRPEIFNIDMSYDHIANNTYISDLNIERYDVISLVKITEDNDNIFILDESANDIYYEGDIFAPIGALPYTLNITNPIYTGYGFDEYFTLIFPSGYDEEDDEDDEYATLIFNTYNADSPLEKISSDFELYILNESTYEYEINTYGFSSGTIYLNNRPNNRHYLMHQSAPGYLDLDTYFDISGTTEKDVYMIPGSEQVTATITTYDGIARDTRISSQSELFILNETTYQWDSIAEFENPGIFFHDTALINREYKLIQNKTGYTPIETTYNINSDTNIDNYMYKEDIGEFDDIVELTYSVFDNQYPSNMISAYYNLSLYNTTSESWISITSGLNSGISILNMPNNYEYNLSLTKYGYTPKDNYFPMTGDRTLNFGMYPIVAEDTYVVTFKVRDFDTGEYISGAKITVNETIKYTPYNGNIAFWDIEDYIIYEVSKPGYVTVTGNKIITENQAIFINLQTEISAYVTPTITPTPPDITQPTNLLESIQFAFQKMFGLTSSAEDMETANLFMGLGIIFAGACLIAVITKDALGAVVGGLIGFIMSLALGFIPLWVLFVGFASFAIYIILTKTGGSE